MTPTANAPDPDRPDALANTTFEVPQLHRAVMQEEDDPRDGFEPVPFWVLTGFMALLLWGGYYLGTHSGDFRGDVLDRPNPPATIR